MRIHRLLAFTFLGGLIGLMAHTGLARSHTLDLRDSAKTARQLKTVRLAGETDGFLRSTMLGAGAGMVSGLAVGDRLTLQLYEDICVSLTLTDALDSPLGGAVFLAQADGERLKTAVVTETPEGLQADILDLKSGFVYSVVSDAERVMVREMNPSAAPKSDTSIPVVSEDSASSLMMNSSQTKSLGASPDLAAAKEETTVDILVAFDLYGAQWANTNHGGVTNFARQAVARMNLALANNELDSLFRFRLVGVSCVKSMATGDMGWILEGWTFSWSSIKSDRERYGADVVALVMDTGSSFGTTGIGYSLEGVSAQEIQAMSDLAYCVVSARAVMMDFTMVHEVGHIMGLGHADRQSVEPGPQSTSYAAGYYFTGNDEVKYHTIMAYNEDDKGEAYVLAPLFSCTNQLWQGVAAGDAMHHNADVLRLTYQGVSAFRASKVKSYENLQFIPESPFVFSQPLPVEIRADHPGVEIYYTTDGSRPSAAQGTLYEVPIVLTKTTTIRAVCVESGKSGSIYEATYFLADFGEALDAPYLKWTTSAAYPWIVQSSDTRTGNLAVQSTDLINWGTASTLSTWVTGPTTLSFTYKIFGYRDIFSVLCSGETIFSVEANETESWQQGKVEIPTGPHEITFSYEIKDKYYKDYFNGVKIDAVKLADPFPYTAPRQPWVSEITKAVRAALTPTFGSESEVVRHISTKSDLDAFNMFALYCGVYSSAAVTDDMKRWAWPSYVFSRILEKPQWFSTEPILRFDSISPLPETTGFKVGVEAPNASGGLKAEALVNYFRAGTDLVTWPIKPVLRQVYTEGNRAILEFEPLASPRLFFKIELDSE